MITRVLLYAAVALSAAITLSILFWSIIEWLEDVALNRAFARTMRNRPGPDKWEDPVEFYD